jgi:hypothetical protein
MWIRIRPDDSPLNPAKIVGAGESWILQPEDPWEVAGYVHGVVFTVMCAGEANLAGLVALRLDRGGPAKYAGRLTGSATIGAGRVCAFGRAVM